MFNDLDAISWASLPQPEWNAPDAVPRALRRIAAATSEQDSHAAYTDYLFAIGNNHAGTYYPVVLPTLPFLSAILAHGTEWAKRTVVEALIDLAASFEPEPGYETVELADGRRAAVAAQLNAAIIRLFDAVRAMGADPVLGKEHRAATTELLAQMERVRADQDRDRAV